MDTVALPDGRRYEYTRLQPAGVGVGVIGFNAAGEVLLEREYRHGVGEVIWQIPGGLADEGEDLQAAGLRELLEETGCRPHVVSPETVQYLGAVWDNPALGPGAATFSRPGAWSEWRRKVGRARGACHPLAQRRMAAPGRATTAKSATGTLIAAVAYLLLNGWL